jgi:hypothetical protein
MPRVAFEPTIPEFEQAQIVHALDRAATVIGRIGFIHPKHIRTVLVLRLNSEASILGRSAYY